MNAPFRIVACLLALICVSPVAAQDGISLRNGTWNAWLTSPGGMVTFQLVMRQMGDNLSVWIVNGAERVQVPEARIEGEMIVLDFVHYNSVIRAAPNATGTSLVGFWKRVGATEDTVMEFKASWSPQRVINDNAAPRQPIPRPGAGNRPGAPGRGQPRAIAESMLMQGRWRVHFESSEEPAVGVFESSGGDALTGTFLTTTGDYRYLSGNFSNSILRLSVFDGAHAFLFLAERKRDGTLAGNFWSRDTYHETWTAVRDPEANLSDAFTLTTLRDGTDLAALSFPDLEGTPRSPADAAYAGKVRIIELFGSWCPNCNDATIYLKELQKTYGERGLSILSLAFEMTGDLERDTAQVKRYVDHHDISWPVLVAGTSDKEKATVAFPLLDKIRSFPTFIFLNEAGDVKAIYQGFSGPATGAAYEKLRDDFARIIDELLTD